MNIRAHIPNMITLGNVVCGFLAIAYTFSDDLHSVVVLFILALICDFADGLIARVLKASSPLGAQLDSLADMVSFGLLPGFILYKLILNAEGMLLFPYDWRAGFPYTIAALLIPLASAWRLGNFNLKHSEKANFYGLPTPANAILMIGLWIIRGWYEDHFMHPLVGEAWFLAVIGLIAAFWLVAPLEMIALKWKGSSWRANKLRYLLVVWIVLCLALWEFGGIPMILLGYLGFSIWGIMVK